MHRLLLALLCLSLTLVACDKEQKPEVNWGNSGTTPTPAPTPDPTPHITPGKMSEANRLAALRIEMPLLTRGGGDGGVHAARAAPTARCAPRAMS